MKTMFLKPSVHIPEDATVKMGEPHPQKQYPKTWVVSLEISAFPGVHYDLTFFGTEAQIRAIGGGSQDDES